MKVIQWLDMIEIIESSLVIIESIPENKEMLQTGTFA